MILREEGIESVDLVGKLPGEHTLYRDEPFLNGFKTGYRQLTLYGHCLGMVVVPEPDFPVEPRNLAPVDGAAVEHVPGIDRMPVHPCQVPLDSPENTHQLRVLEE